MEVAMLGVLLPIIITLGAFVMIVYIRKYMNAERIMIIEKGLDPKMFRRDRTEANSPVLRWALLLMGAGFGLLVGFMLDEAYYMEAAGYFSMLLIFGGLGLTIAYLVEERKAKRRSN